MEIKIGYALAKPVETQAQCDAYTAMVEAVNAHNAACAVGDTLWSIADKPGCYEVTDGGVKSDPADQPKPEPTLKEKLEALQEDNKTLKEENTMITQCLMEMSEIVYAYTSLQKTGKDCFYDGNVVGTGDHELRDDRGSKGNVCPLPPPAEGEGESHSGEERL